MEPIRKDVFAEDMRLKNPSLKYWDDDRILNYVHDNFPEVASSIEWLDPPSEPSVWEKSSAPWLEMKDRMPQYWQSAKTSFANAYRLDPDEGKEMQDWLGEQGVIGTRDVDWEAKREEYEKKDEADLKNYLEAKRVADEKVNAAPSIQAVKAWYAENPVHGFGEWFTSDNIAYGFNQMASSYLPIATSAFLGSLASPIVGYAAAVGTAYTMEAGNNFDTAYATLLKEGVPKEKAFHIAKQSAHWYGIASGFLESIAPTRLMKSSGLPRRMRERTARIFQKDILKDTWKQTGKSYASKEMGKKMQDGAVEFTHKYGAFKNKFATDSVVGNAVKGIAGGLWKAGKAVVKPTKIKVEQAVIEGITEGAQWLAEEAINDGFVLPENGTPGEWDWNEIVSTQWLSEKVKSDGFKSSVAMGMMTYFLPFGRGGTTQFPGGQISVPTSEQPTGEVSTLVNKLGTIKGQAVSSGRVKILSDDKAPVERDDTSPLPEPVQKWRDLIDPNKFDATSTESPKDQMLRHALSSPTSLQALESGDLEDEEKFRIIQQLGEAINTSNLPEDYNISLPSVDGKYNSEDVLGILKKLTVSKSNIVTEKVASGGMETSTKQRVNIAAINKEDLVKMQTRPQDFNMLNLDKMVQQEVSTKPEDAQGEMVLPVLDRYRKIHIEQGPVAAKAKIMKSTPEQFRNLVKAIGAEDFMGGTEVFDRNKDGSITASRKNKELVYEWINGFVKRQIAEAQEVDFAGDESKKIDIESNEGESKGPVKGEANVQKPPQTNTDQAGGRALDEILSEYSAILSVLNKANNQSGAEQQDLKDRLRVLKGIAEEAGHEFDDESAPVAEKQMVEVMAGLKEIMQSKDRKGNLKKILWKNNTPESVLAALKQMKDHPLTRYGMMPEGMIDAAIKLQLELMSEIEGEPFPIELMIDPPVGKYKGNELSQEDKVFNKNLEKESRIMRASGMESGAVEETRQIKNKDGKVVSVKGSVVTKKSPISGKVNAVWIPGWTKEAQEAHRKGAHIQNIIPNVHPEIREFVISGTTPNEFKALFDEEGNVTEDNSEVEDVNEEVLEELSKDEPIVTEQDKRTKARDNLEEALHILSALTSERLTFNDIQKATGIDTTVLTVYIEHYVKNGFIRKVPLVHPILGKRVFFSLTVKGQSELQDMIKRYSDLRDNDTGFKGVNDDSEPDFSRVDIKNKVNQPYIKDTPELAEKIAARLDEHFGKIGITGDSVQRLFDKHGLEVAGMALKNLALWSEEKARIDDIPHEYFHIYMDLFIDHPLFQAALKRFRKDFDKFDPDGIRDAKENLAHLIDEYYAGRIQNDGLMARIRAWIRQLWLKFKGYFKKLSKEEYGLIIGEKFFQGWIPEEGRKVSPWLQGTSEIYFSHIDDNDASFDDQTNEDGQPEEIDALDNLKSGASDLFFNGIFIKEMGTYISNKFMVVDVYEAAKSSVNFEEFSEWFIGAVQEKFGGAIREGREELYDKYARQLYNAKKSSTKLYGYYENEVHEDGSRDMVIIDPDGRIRYEMVFEVEGGNAKDHTLGIISKNHRVRRGTQNPQSFRQNFVEGEREEGNIDARFVELPVKMLINHVHPMDESMEPFYSDKWVYFNLSAEWIDNFDKMLAENHKNGRNNLMFFFSTKSGDKPSIFFSSVPTRWIGSAQPELAGKPVDVRKIDRDFLIKELKAQAAAGWLIWNETDGGHAQNLIGDGDKLIGMRSKKVNSGKVDKKGKKIYAYTKVPNNPYAYAQILAYHIRWQQLKGNRYLMREGDGDSVRETVRRLSLDFGEGVVIQGAPDRRIMWADWTQVEVEMPDEHGDMQRVELKGIRGNKWDGGLFNGGRYLSELSRLLGRNPTAMMKTVIRHLSSDLNDYYVSKHMEFSPWKGMKIYKKGQSFPIARVVGSSNDSYFMLLDAAGNDIGEFDTFETTTELKDKDGIYSEPWAVHSLPGRATRAIIIPSSSRNTAPHPVNFHELVLDDILLDTPEGKEYTRLLNRFIKDKVGDYMDRIIQFRLDKMSLSEYLDKELEEGQMPTEIERIVRMFPLGEGLSIPQYNRQIVAMLSNRFITNGAFKLRTSPNHGTKLYAKPHDLRIEDGKYAAAADSKPLVNLIIDEYIKSPLSGSATNRSQIGWQNDHEMIADLNSFLIRSDLDFLLHRQPIQGATKVEPRVLQQFVEGFHGDAIFVSNKDLAELHDGDNDGDTLYIEYENPELNRAIGALSKTERWAEMDKIVKTSMFLGNLSSTTLSKREDRGKFYEGMSDNEGSQGKAVSAKVISSTMGHKNINFGLSFLPVGHRIHARKSSDIVVMDYIELDPNMSKEDHDIIANNNDRVVMFRMNKDTKQREWATVPWEFQNEKGEMVNGLKTAAKAGYKLHLETTHGNQMSNVIMFAVDNPAEGLLNQFPFTWDFLMDLMWYQTIDGEIAEGGMPKGVNRYLSAAFNVFNRGKTRRGRSMKNNSMSMGSLQSESERVRSMYFEENGDPRSPEAVNATIRTLLNGTTKNKKGENFKVYVKGLGQVETFVTDVQGDAHKVTPMERLIAQPDLHLLIY